MADQQDLAARVEALEVIIDVLATVVSDADPKIEQALLEHLRVATGVLRNDLGNMMAAGHVEAFADLFQHRS